MARFLYSITLAVLSPLIVCYLFIFRAKKNAAYRAHFAERFAFKIHHLPKNATVFHCASVGEVLAATPLINQYKISYPDIPIIITCNTPTGRVQIQQQFNNSINTCYLPIDFFFSSKRFINILRPTLLVVLETELWPNLFAHAQKAHCAVCVINARLSDKSFRGYQRVRALSKNIMQNITVLASHNDEDAQRFFKLGLSQSKISVTGSIKFDISFSDQERNFIKTLKNLLGDRPVWVAGSTHPVEHQQVLDAHKLILNEHPLALLIIAPRHPEQFESVAQLITNNTFTYQKRSDGCFTDQQVLLADTLGELKCLYGAANVAFIGGSLISRGGHNPLEAAALSVGVITGPSTYNFDHIYPHLLKNNAAMKVNDHSQLATHISHCFSDPHHATRLGDNALKCVKNAQGAINKTLSLLNEHTK